MGKEFEQVVSSEEGRLNDYEPDKLDVLTPSSILAPTPELGMEDNPLRSNNGFTYLKHNQS
ncbi:MAG UNVERIFIED_CONTAM: hypothetical protein LVQ98_06040 [Rickettsiaceae bacterium]|jgi:hypothetical protein